VEKPKKISQIDPKTAVETARVQTPIHQRIVPLDHHEAFTLETVHHEIQLSDALHHQGQAPSQESAAENRRAERQVRTGSDAGVGSVKQVSDTSLDHQHRQGEERAHAEPP
jgi:hypothetical protein